MTPGSDAIDSCYDRYGKDQNFKQVHERDISSPAFHRR